MLNSIQRSPVDRLNLKNIYCCVLVTGTNGHGVPLYAYFGVFLEKIEEMFRVIQAGRPFNPKDFSAIVLARAVGQPSPEIRSFMKTKFSFSEEDVLLEISQR